MRHALLLVVIVATAGCIAGQNAGTKRGMKQWSASSQHDRNLMIGKWLDEGKTDDGKFRVTLAERNDNGTYRITFRSYVGSNYEESIEVGLWGISGPVYFTIMRGWMNAGEFKSADATQSFFYDAYRILSLNETLFEYESAENGNHYRARRVGNDFQFSD